MTLALDSLQAGRAALAEHFPLAATYQPPAGASVAVTVVVHQIVDQHGLDDLHFRRLRRARFTIRAAQVALPVREGIITVAAGSFIGVWKVDEVTPLAGGDHDVTAQLTLSESTQDPSTGNRRGLG